MIIAHKYFNHFKHIAVEHFHDRLRAKLTPADQRIMKDKNSLFNRRNNWSAYTAGNMYGTPDISQNKFNILTSHYSYLLQVAKPLTVSHYYWQYPLNTIGDRQKVSGKGKHKNHDKAPIRIMEQFLQFAPGFYIIDESHSMVSPKARFWAQIAEIKRQHLYHRLDFFELSGTLIGNSPSNLVPILDCLYNNS